MSTHRSKWVVVGTEPRVPQCEPSIHVARNAKYFSLQYAVCIERMKLWTLESEYKLCFLVFFNLQIPFHLYFNFSLKRIAPGRSPERLPLYLFGFGLLLCLKYLTYAQISRPSLADMGASSAFMDKQSAFCLKYETLSALTSGWSAFRLRYVVYLWNADEVHFLGNAVRRLRWCADKARYVWKTRCRLLGGADKICSKYAASAALTSRWSETCYVVCLWHADKAPFLENTGRRLLFCGG